jgi:molybdopterin converting factor small subunit
MPSVRIPTPLRGYAAGQREVSVQGTNVAQAMGSLVEQHPSLRPHLFTEEGELRAFVNLFLGEENVKDLQGLETAVGEEDRLMLIPSIAGG